MGKLKSLVEGAFAVAVALTILDCMDKIAALTDSLEAKEKQLKMLSIHDEILQQRTADLTGRLEAVEKKR
jgi:hypothetical protein